MIAKSKSVFLLAFAEGGALLAYQLVCAKLLAPWFGTSLEVWSAILGLTLAGLALGYAWGASLATTTAPAKRVTVHMTIAAIFLISLPWWHPFVQGAASPTGLRSGVVLSGLVLISPLMILLGTFSPLSISMLERFGYPAHRATGIIFGTSTLGGVVYALAVGLIIAPFYGLTTSCYILGGTLLAAVLLFAGSTSVESSADSKSAVTAGAQRKSGTAFSR